VRKGCRGDLVRIVRLVRIFSARPDKPIGEHEGKRRSDRQRTAEPAHEKGAFSAYSAFSAHLFGKPSLIGMVCLFRLLETTRSLLGGGKVRLPKTVRKAQLIQCARPVWRRWRPHAAPEWHLIESRLTRPSEELIAQRLHNLYEVGPRDRRRGIRGAGYRL
jgi:hypothetical protein